MFTQHEKNLLHFHDQILLMDYWRSRGRKRLYWRLFSWLHANEEQLSIPFKFSNSWTLGLHHLNNRSEKTEGIREKKKKEKNNKDKEGVEETSIQSANHVKLNVHFKSMPSEKGDQVLRSQCLLLAWTVKKRMRQVSWDITRRRSLKKTNNSDRQDNNHTIQSLHSSSVYGSHSESKEK